jgi:hypothetical protein
MEPQQFQHPNGTVIMTDAPAVENAGEVSVGAPAGGSEPEPEMGTDIERDHDLENRTVWYVRQGRPGPGIFRGLLVGSLLGLCVSPSVRPSVYSWSLALRYDVHRGTATLPSSMGSSTGQFGLGSPYSFDGFC